MAYDAPTELEAAQRRAELSKHDLDNQRALLGIWSTFFGRPETYLDVGCGSGAMVDFAESCGVEAIGVDITAVDPHVRHNLKDPLDLDRTFQLVTCLEVAEHLPPYSAEVLVASIERHMHPGSLLVFSAAAPGQGGDNHVNLRPGYYWRSLFWDVGVRYLIEDSVRLSLVWSQTTGAMMWLPANVQVFRR